MKNRNIDKTLKILVLALSGVIFMGCNFAAKSSAKNEKTITQPEIKAEATPKPAATIDAKLFGKNLIKNGDAETGNGDGWSNSDELKTIVYGDFGGGPATDSPGPTNRGDKYFYARTTREAPTADFTQKIDVSGAGEVIDKSLVNYNFGSWFGVANGSASIGRLKVTFLDKDNKQISTDETAEIKEADRPADLVLTERNKSGLMPAGTRKIEVVLEFYIFPGHKEENVDNLAFADNLSLVLTQKQ